MQPLSLISVENLNFSFDRKHAILLDINLHVYENDYLVIMGPNGGGKTTLLKCMLGLLKPDSGKVRYHGVKTGDLGYVPQFTTFDRQMPLRVYDFIESGLIGRYRPLMNRVCDKEHLVDQQIARFHLEPIAYSVISEISGGQLQRALLARALIQDPKILFLDEPTTFIDSESRGNLSSILFELNKKIAIVMITHDTSSIDDHVKNIACVNRNLYYHCRDEYIAESLEKVYGCPIELIAHGLPHRVLKEHK
ncbi:MAG: ATP-binding cassette domain-containing protein [Candidatus Neomarinimicrobiota bacterium]|jgi:zinc transport system ATP-binding protein|nr:ATP-binding cassette domain-containing protein [Candidatus Neomarinimicrobiota bacterium]MDD3965871.1 ATP-binding cassette domain-containing protein [Candidatus Neomarinimicrobiota bacterium]MDX9780063.1 ATP-binding cassette domain-containing protein [bacterium]